MVDETSLFMSRYSRDLYARLEQETGHSTGFREIGHVSLATTPARLDALRRASAWMHGFGVPDVELSPREVADMWPLLRTDDVLAGFHVADEGRADPVGVTVSLAKGARSKGVRVVEGVSAIDVEVRGGRVSAVLTDAGRIETEVVVNAGGMWARQFGQKAGVTVPLQAAEHYYLLTGPVPGMDPDLAVIEDPDRYGYYRPEGDGMLVGLFEPVAAPWSLDGVPHDFSFGTLPPDWDRMAPFLERAMDRIPSLADVGVRLFFCGPESFTTDLHPLLGPAPGARWLLGGRRAELAGHPAGGRGGHGDGALDRRRRAAGRRHGVRRSIASPPTRPLAGSVPSARSSSWATSSAMRSGPRWKPQRARDVRRSVLHDRLAAAGAHFGASCGWEFAEWFAGSGRARGSPHPTSVASRRTPFVEREHRAVREAVGVLDMSLMAKLTVQGPHAAAGTEPAVGERHRPRGRPGGLHPVARRRRRHRGRRHRHPPR